MIEIHENAVPRLIDGYTVIVGRRDDGVRVYMARKNGRCCMGLTPKEAIAGCRLEP